MTSAYTRDVSFPATFSPQQAPIHISAVAALHGVRRDFKGRFTYCDYGCGQGLTLALVAACYPEAQFFGVDMNSAHIETARAFASSCSIENVEFIEADFLSMNSGDLPLLDFAAVSGVYSWLPAEKRRRLACIIAGGLKDGGACALQYRCMPGSASRLTTDGLATFLAGRASGASSARIVSALSAVSHIIDAPDLAFNKVNPTAREHLKEQLAADPDYLAHDMNADYAGVGFIGR
ncbi:MAG: class I SAM-dependent methyltransferase [Parvularculaceae bacterium]